MLVWSAPNRDATSVRELLRPVAGYLELPGVTELCVNRPGQIHIENSVGWVRLTAPELTETWARALAIAVASYAAQPVSRAEPFLSARLPDGERLQVVLPPGCAEGNVVMSIRLPCRSAPSLADFEAQGAFDCISIEDPTLSESDLALLALARERRIREFLVRAVRLRKNIAIVGDTGSGKTTLMRALCELIEEDQRVVTIEDTHEIDHLHSNCVHLFYNESLGVSPSSCVRAALRLRPDRVMLAELRGSEAFDFLNVLMTGHPGSITCFHADSCAIALERFAIMAGSHEAARMYSESRLMRLAVQTIDVVVHLTRTRAGRRMTALHFDPGAKIQGSPAKRSVPNESRCSDMSSTLPRGEIRPGLELGGVETGSMER